MRGQSIAKCLRLGPLPAADEDPLLAAARERAPERVDVRPRLGRGPAVEDFLARQRDGALAQELPDGFEGGKPGLWRAVRQQQVVGSFRVQLGGDVFKSAGITADAVHIPTPQAPVAAGSLQVHDDVGEGGQGAPMGRPSTVKDITDAVMYLTDAGTVTGHILYADGGAHFGRW